MINNDLIKAVKGTLSADLTVMQKEILKGVLIMMTNRICYDIDVALLNMDKLLKGIDNGI